MAENEKPTRILVVDDEAELADNLSEILKARGYMVETATDGGRAMALCRETNFDIAIVDIKLPDTGGLELVRHLANAAARTDCILITGYASLETAVEAVRHKSVAGYEIKPLDTDRLLSLITQIAQRKQAEDALRRAHDELEARVVQRTADLANANRELQAEIAERKRVAEVLRRSEENERRFQQRLRALLEVTHELSQAASFDDLCRQAVELGRERLGFDRLGIWFFDESDPSTIVGSFGTDRAGRVRDERAWRRHAPGLSESMRKGGGLQVAHRQAPVLEDNGEAVHVGEQALAPVSNGMSVIGLISTDNLLLAQPITPHDRELLVLFASALGGLCSRQRSGQALRESEELFRSVVENSHDGIFIVDDAHRFVYVNDQLCRILGYSREEIMGHDFREFIAEDSKELVTDRYLRRQRGEDIPPQYEFDIVGKDGERRRLAISAAVIRNSAGQVQTVGQVLDVTERKKIEEQLLRAQRMESTGTLASGVAHNFNNILGIILGNAELLKMTVSENYEAQEFADKIVMATERAASLAQQLLAVARRQSRDRDRTSTTSLIDGVARTLSVMLDSNMQIHWRPPKDASEVLVSRPDVEQVLMNICLNARDAMPKGGSITIEAGTVDLPQQFCDAHENMKAGRYACLAITDTGVGMSREILSRIFDPFFTTKAPGKGTGLGLATAHGTVVSHGGCIDVRSELGKGSTFYVYLPVAPDAEPTEASGVAPELYEGTETILLADDEEDILIIGRRILERLGYTVVTARNGEEAIEIYRRQPERFGAVILDYMMPKVDGEDTFAAMKKIDPNVKVLMASGYQNDARIQRVLDAGAMGFAHKPYHLSDLSQSLRDILRKKQG